MEKKEKVNIIKGVLLDKETEDRNRNIYKYILPYFYPSEMTHERLIKAQYGALDKVDQHLDTMLHLDSQRRVAFSIDSSLVKDLDESFKVYTEILSQCSNERTISELVYKMKTSNIMEKAELLRAIKNYDNFKDNKIDFKNNKHKLFKLLLNSGFITKTLEESISQARSNINNMILVISRNPIDYIMCATGQNFKSCMSLFSDTRACYYMGLPYLTLDPNRALIFLTDGSRKHRIANTKGLDPKHPLVKEYGQRGYIELSYFNMLQRSWLLLDKNNNLIIVRNFDTCRIKFSDLLGKCKEYKDIKSYHSKQVDSYIEGREVGKFPFNIGTNISGYTSSIYLDHIDALSSINKGTKISENYSPKGLDTENHIRYVKRNFGLGANTFAFKYSFRYGKGIKFLIETNMHNFMEFEKYQGTWRCYICNKIGIEGALSKYYDKERNSYCSNCFSSNFRTCNLCGEYYRLSSGKVNSIHNISSICGHCLDKLISVCKVCSKEMDKKEQELSCYIKEITGYACNNCKKTRVCNCICCNSLIIKSNETDDEICRKCQVLEGNNFVIPKYIINTTECNSTSCSSPRFYSPEFYYNEGLRF